MSNLTKDPKELAYLYDLYIVPEWREAFDSLVDDEVKLPDEGKFLDAECGMGSYVIDMAMRGGAKVEVVGIDPSPERLMLGRGKAEIKKLDRVIFQEGSLTTLGLPDDTFDLVIGDASMLPSDQIASAFGELARVARKGATVALKLTLRGSFDEFFSIYWETLYESELAEYEPQLEELINERLTVTHVERLAQDSGLNHVRSVTRNEQLYYSDGRAFFDAPLIETVFLNGWFAILPDQKIRQGVEDRMIKIIDRERQDMNFDVSIKATLIIGQK